MYNLGTGLSFCGKGLSICVRMGHHELSILHNSNGCVTIPQQREKKRGHTNRRMHIHRQTIRNIMDKLSAKDCRCDSLSLSKICKEFVTEKYISTSFLLFLSSMWKLVVAIAPLISNSSSSSSTFLIANKLVRRWRYQPTDRKRLCLTDY